MKARNTQTLSVMEAVDIWNSCTETINTGSEYMKENGSHPHNASMEVFASVKEVVDNHNAFMEDSLPW